MGDPLVVLAASLYFALLGTILAGGWWVIRRLIRRGDL